MIFATLGYTAYVAHVKPFESKILNFLEVFNECVVMSCLYHMLIFTEGLVSDREMLYSVGWVMDIILVIHFLLNMLLIAYSTLHTAVAMFKRFLRLQRLKALKEATLAKEKALKK